MDIIPITTQFIHYLLQEPLHPSLLQVVLSDFLQAMSTLDFMRQIEWLYLGVGEKREVVHENLG